MAQRGRDERDTGRRKRERMGGEEEGKRDLFKRSFQKLEAGGAAADHTLVHILLSGLVYDYATLGQVIVNLSS